MGAKARAPQRKPSGTAQSYGPLGLRPKAGCGSGRTLERMVEVSREAFEELVAEALDSLPPALAKLMDNVAIFIEDDPPPGEHLLGLYQGVPLTERGYSYAMALPDRITIFRRPILWMSADAAQVRDQVRITVVHEIAHHFGTDDETLHDLGYG